MHPSILCVFGIEIRIYNQIDMYMHRYQFDIHSMLDLNRKQMYTRFHLQTNQIDSNNEANNQI